MTPLRIAVAAVGLLLVVAQPATAAEWTVKPAADSFGAGRQDYRYTIDPGGQVEDGIVVSNHGAALLQLKLSAAGAWVHLDQDELTVPPGETVQVPFAVSPPGDAAPGDHAGRIVTSAPDARVGLPVRLRVGGALRPSLAVSHVRVHYSHALAKGDATVTYTVVNTGNAILSARQTVSASGPFGRWAVRAGKLADSPPLLPGQTWKGSAPLHGVTPALRLTATVTLVPLLTDAAGSIAPLAATRASGHAWAIPWALLLLCGLAVAGVAFVVRRRPAIRA